MKTVVGVDLNDRYRSAVTLLDRLRFEGNRLRLVHAVESLLLGASAYPSPVLEGQIDLTEAMQGAAEQRLGVTVQWVREQGLEAEAVTRIGHATSTLMAEADGNGAELIAVTAVRSGTFGHLFFGSVTKGLLVGAHESLLVAKGEVAPEGNLHAVFATDHSEYATRSLERLFEMKPQGLRRVTVLTANALTDEAERDIRRQVPGMADSVPALFHDRLHDLNNAVASRFSEYGIEATSHVVRGHPNEAIAREMEASGADLLILGAQGHGFFERLTIGSVSFHQVTSTDYPVLVLRDSRARDV